MASRVKYASDQVNEWLDQDMKEVAPYVPGGAWGEVKTILSVLRGNDAHWVAGAFKNAHKKGDVGYPNFYIDSRERIDPVKSAFSGGSQFVRRDYASGKRELDKAHASLRDILNSRRDIVARFKEAVKAGKEREAERLLEMMSPKQLAAVKRHVKK